VWFYASGQDITPWDDADSDARIGMMVMKDFDGIASAQYMSGSPKMTTFAHFGYQQQPDEGGE
jgi:hypothetical protein